jgi:hypothetical protein
VTSLRKLGGKLVITVILHDVICLLGEDKKLGLGTVQKIRIYKLICMRCIQQH